MKRAVSVILAVLLICLAAGCACADDPFEGMKVYYEGQYKAGTDFTPGEYVLINTSSGFSGYFCISRDANQDDIIANDLFEVNSIVTVKSGEYLQLSRCVAVDIDDFYSRYTIKTENPGTMLRVGYDIQPGEYKVTAEEGKTGYYCIYNDSRHTDIVKNDLFKNSSWVTVRSGQYLILSRCYIK